MSQLSFSGVWTAIATPFTATGELDIKAFERLLQIQAEGKVTGIVVSGTTGESPTLSVQEKISLVRKARVALPQSIRVMAGTGGNDTNQTVELSKLAVDAGADSLLIVTPPYNKPSTAGLLAHFNAVSEAVPVDLCMYHVPGRTAQLLSAEVIGKICQVPRLKSVKEASGDVALFSRALLAAPKTSFLSGDDPTYLASLAVGGDGVISVISNIYPKAMVVMTNAYKDGQVARARQIHDILLPAIDAMFFEANPCPLKAALHSRTLAHNTLRLPLVPVQPENYQRIISILNQTDGKLKALETKAGELL